MSLTPQTITIDLNPSFSQMQTVHCSQYDDNIRQIEVKLKDGGTDIDVSSYTIYIEGTKPDKKGFSYPLTDIGSVSGNTVTFYVQLQMAAVPGMTRMEILLKDGDDHRIGSANFMLAVERAGLQDDTDVSDSELAPYISGAAEQAAAAARSAEAAELAKTAAIQAKESAEQSAESISGLTEQIEQNTEDTRDLKNANSNIGYETVITSDNLLDPDAVMMQTYINDQGEPVYSQHYVTTGLMPVKPNTKYSMFCVFQNTIISNPTAKVCAYDASGNYLSNLGQITYSSSAPSYVTTPADCAFVRAQLSTGNYTSYPIVMFAETNGTTMPSAVVPYASKKVISVDNFIWKGKTWVAFGDSLTEKNAMTTIHYYDYVKGETGIDVTVMGVGGTGYAKGGTNAFYNRIVNVPTDADVITIFGSFNDLSSGLSLGTETDTGTETIAGCMNTTLDNLFTTYPLAVVGIVAPTPWQSATPLSETSSASQYCALLKRICERRSIPYLDLFHSSLLRPWDASFKSLAYTKDGGGGTHPDETGHELIAPRFKGFLETLLM